MKTAFLLVILSGFVRPLSAANSEPKVVSISKGVIHTTPLHVDQFWVTELPPVPDRTIRSKAIISLHFERSKLWTTSLHEDSGYIRVPGVFERLDVKNLVVVHEVDLDTLKGREVFRQPTELFQDAIPVPGMIKPQALAPFAFDGERISFVEQGQRIQVYELARGTWQATDLPFKASPDTVLVTSNKRLFLVSQGMLAELDLARRTADTLVSARRKPALNLLDERGLAGWVKLWAGSSSGDAIVLRKTGRPEAIQIYQRPAGASDWKLVLETKLDGLLTSDSPDALVLYNAPLSRNTVIAWSPTGPPALLLADGTQEAFGFSKTARAKWPHPKGLPATQPNVLSAQTHQAGTKEVCSDGSNLWVAYNAQADAQAPQDGRHAALWHFDDRWEMPIAIPLVFESANRSGSLPPFAPGPQLPQMPGNLLWTPKGLVLLAGNTFTPTNHGFWFIPSEKLKSFVQAIASQAKPRARPGVSSASNLPDGHEGTGRANLATPDKPRSKGAGRIPGLVHSTLSALGLWLERSPEVLLW
ncbi:MAG: hypothetical protein AB1705_07430 [Verrucomicrobiota bacterium]